MLAGALRAEVLDLDASEIADLLACATADWSGIEPTIAGTLFERIIDPAKLTTITRPDGLTQSAYDGHPLYHFARDAAPGDLLGRGVHKLGLIGSSMGGFAAAWFAQHGNLPANPARSTKLTPFCMPDRRRWSHERIRTVAERVTGTLSQGRNACAF